MNHPKVSVIIPSYQCATYIEQAIASVLRQTGCSYEIIIIDDGSSDDTGHIVAQLQQKFPQAEIHYIYQSNQGVCAARNHGLKLSRGELLVFLDADDYFLPNKLKAHAAVFDHYPDLGLIQTGWQIVDQQGSKVKDVTPWTFSPHLDLESWLRFKPVLPSAMMIRRHWLESIGGFNVEYQAAEDVDLVLRLSLAGCQSGWLREVTVAYRQHSNNTMKNGVIQFRDVKRVVEQFFSTKNLPQSIRLIEPEVRYHTLVWLACFLYFGNHTDTMIGALEESLHWSPLLVSETVVNWVESLSAFAQQEDLAFDMNQFTQSPQWKALVANVIMKD